MLSQACPHPHAHTHFLPPSSLPGKSGRFPPSSLVKICMKRVGGQFDTVFSA